MLKFSKSEDGWEKVENLVLKANMQFQLSSFYFSF